MLVLALYRRLPRWFRKWLLGIMSATLQRRLIQVLVVRTPAGRLADRKVLGRVGDRVRVSHAGKSVLARICTDTSPAKARAHNLAAVLATLDDAGIDYFCVPGPDIRSVVAVSDTRRGRTVELLQSVLGARGFCVWPAPAGARRTTRTRRSAPAVRTLTVFEPLTDRVGGWILGRQFQCTVEFWTEADGWLVAPRAGPLGRIPQQDPCTTAPGNRFSRFVIEGADAHYRTRAAFALPRADHVSFPIDVVYTWVDGSDPLWQLRKNAALGYEAGTELNALAANDARYANREELRYSMRSVTYFAPWVRHIYLVTDDQLPPWLDVSHPKITWIRHRDIFPDANVLPTFNSHAIEAYLHRIPGLAEHFLYFNDDMFLGCPVVPHTFFHANGVAKFFASPAEIEPGVASLQDPPVTAAGKNNRRHLIDRFGRTITQKMRHVPYPLRRSVIAEIEQGLAMQVHDTGAHRFRHPGDLSIPSSLAHYWAFLTARAVPGSIRYVYADLGHAYTPLHMHRMLRRRTVQVFCLNDTDSGDLLADRGDPTTRLVERFLKRYFPFPAPFEHPDHETRQRQRRGATALAQQALQEVRDRTASTPRQANEPVFTSTRGAEHE